MNLPIDTASFSTLLHRLYASDGSPWPSSAFLRQCCNYIGASSGAILVVDLDSGQSRYIDNQFGSRSIVAEYENWYMGKDPLQQALMKQAPRRFYTRDELVTPEEIESDPYFNEWFPAHGYDDVCGARIPLSSQYSCNVGFTRNVGDEPFGRAELDFLDLLLPHIEQCLKLHKQIDRLSVLSDLAQEHVSQIGAGLLILNEDGRINFMNRIAQGMLEDSGVLVETNGLVEFNDPEVQAHFASLVEQCITAALRPGVMTGGVALVPRANASAMGVMVMPYRNKEANSGFVAKTSRATVLMFDPDRPRLTPPLILRELYHLSESEVQVCWRLANGESLEEIGAGLGVAKETLRSQLKRIFAKTGTSRQPELVRLVLMGPALWASMQPPATTPSGNSRLP